MKQLVQPAPANLSKQCGRKLAKLIATMRRIAQTTNNHKQ